MTTPDEGDLKPAVCFACSYDPLVELKRWREHKPHHLVLRSELPQTPTEASLCTICGNISGSSEGNKCPECGSLLTRFSALAGRPCPRCQSPMEQAE
jgi:hypothetical protein